MPQRLLALATRSAGSLVAPRNAQRRRRRPARAMADGGGGDAAARQRAAALELLPLLGDAHAHPQLDAANAGATARLRVPAVAAMGVGAAVDWGGVEALAAGGGPCAVIPGFGIHP